MRPDRGLAPGKLWLRKENPRHRLDEPDWCFMMLCLDASGDGAFAFFRESGEVYTLTNGDKAWIAWEAWEEAPS